MRHGENPRRTVLIHRFALVGARNDESRPERNAIP